MRSSYLARTIALAPLALAMSAGAALAAGNPCSPLTYGAAGDGTVGTNNGTLNTVAIQSAINACAAAGGGIVSLTAQPNGKNVYLTGPIQLLSHVLLEVGAGVTLLATTDEGQYSVAYLDYPMPVASTPPYAPVAPYEALVFAYQATDTGIIGTGTINGQGNVVSTSTDRPAGTGTGANRFTGPSYIGTTVGTPSTLYSWWTLPTPGNGAVVNAVTWYKAPQTDIPTSNGAARPWLVEWYQCQNVTVNGITLVDSPMWTMVARYSSNINISNYHVQDYSNAAATIPSSTGSNTDGFDPVGSSFVTITNFTVQNGDDIIAIKSGLPLWVQSGVQGAPGSDPNEINGAGVYLPQMPTHDMTIANTTLLGGSNSGISIGSEASNGVYNILLENIHEAPNAQGQGTSVGLRIKTGRVRGNYAIGDHDITVQNMTLVGTPQPIAFYSYYPASDGPAESTSSTWDKPQAIQPFTPNVYNITVSNLVATGATSTSLIVGVPESCILNVNLNNVSITANTSGIATTTTPLPAGMTSAAGMFQLRNVQGTFTNVNLTSTHTPPIAPFAVQENVHVTATGTPGINSLSNGEFLNSPVTTHPLATTPAGADCAATNNYPQGTTP
jgi:polygalacturonase